MRYLGIDFGLKRIGLSTSEGNIASPLKTLEVKGFKDAIRKVEEVISLESSEKIIVGLPEGKMGQTVLGFINALKNKGYDVESSDETLTSKEALKQMIELGVPRNKRKHTDDRAAGIILQNYLDSIVK